MYSGEFTRQKQQIIAIISIILIVFLCYKLALPYYHFSQIQTEAQKVVNWDRENYIEPPPSDVIQKQIMEYAHKRNLPITRRNIKVKYEMPATIIATVQYTVPVNLLVKSFDWDFSFKVQTEELY